MLSCLESELLAIADWRLPNADRRIDDCRVRIDGLTIADHGAE
jgi:hypothetical protein